MHYQRPTIGRRVRAPIRAARKDRDAAPRCRGGGGRQGERKRRVRSAKSRQRNSPTIFEKRDSAASVLSVPFTSAARALKRNAASGYSCRSSAPRAQGTETEPSDRSFSSFPSEKKREIMPLSRGSRVSSDKRQGRQRPLSDIIPIHNLTRIKPVLSLSRITGFSRVQI